nr:hypothetical protein [uncultured Flavobacterium sp.]
MQILKYLFYLLALTLVSVSIYILTLEKQFNIQDQFQVDVKEVYAQNYINDLKNWEEMIPTQQIDTLQNSSFYSNQITISLDSTYAKNSLFSIYLSGKKIGDLTYTFNDTLNASKTNINSKFIGEVSFFDKITIFLKGVSPSYYFKKAVERVNDNIQNKINTDFNFKTFHPIKTDSISKMYYYKSRFTDTIINRDKIMKDYLSIKKELNKNDILNKSFFIDVVIDQPKRKEYFIGIPVKNKITDKTFIDIYLDSIQPGKILKTSFTGSFAYQNEYTKQVTKEIKQNKFEIDKSKTLKVWNDDLKSSNPKNWTFDTWYYFLPEKPKVYFKPSIKADSVSVLETTQTLN